MQSLSHFSSFGSSPFVTETESEKSILISSAPSALSASMGQLPSALVDRLHVEGRRLKIEILECKGGSGHEMSAEAVKRAVESHFGKENVEISKYDVGSHLAPDPFSMLTFGRLSMIQFHNYLARNGHTKLISVLSKVGRVASALQSPFTERHFTDRYKKNRPDLVISAIPMINGTVLKGTSKLDIPLMVVCTDGDNSMFGVNWHKTSDNAPYRYGIPYNSFEIAQKVSKNIDQSKVRGIGYPLRSGYTTKYTPEQRLEFRKKHLVSPGEKFVGIMMGGLGGQVTKQYFQRVLKGIDKGELTEKNTRFSFFCGNNNEMKNSLIARLGRSGWSLDVGAKQGIAFFEAQKQRMEEVVSLIEKMETLLGEERPLEAVRDEVKEKLEECLMHQLPAGVDFETDPELSSFQKINAVYKDLCEKDPKGESFKFALALFKKRTNSSSEKFGNYADDLRIYRHASGASITLLGFTRDDHEYVAFSDLWVTKTGSSTFNQCLFTQTPMLLDGTSRPLDWEALNFELADTYSFGETLSKFKSLFTQLNDMLKPENSARYRKAEEEYLQKRSEQTCFSKKIVDLTYELLEEAEDVKVNKQEKAAEESKVKTEALEAWKKLTPLEKIGKIFLQIFQVVVAVAMLICRIALAILTAPVRWAGKKLVNYAFFSGFNSSESTRIKRRKALIRDKGAEPIEGESSPLASPVSNRPIDAIRIPSTSTNPTGNTIVYVLGKHYQDFHPNNYEHLLEDGADVVLFNPSKKSTEAMAADLKEVLKELRRRNPEEKLLLHGYCIGAHVAAAAAADIAAGNVEGMAKESIPAIIDRGFSDATELAQHVSSLGKLSFVRKYLNRYYNAKAAGLEDHQAPMLFVTPLQGDDQLNHRVKRNFTLEIMSSHKKGMNQFVQLKNGDHWSSWSVDVQNKVKEFLKKQEIIDMNYRQVTVDDFGGVKKYTQKLSVPWARRKIIPLFV
jgi:UDP-N-acetylglucosamine:LPS N-acetylglucosamine transferase